MSSIRLGLSTLLLKCCGMYCSNLNKTNVADCRSFPTTLMCYLHLILLVAFFAKHSRFSEYIWYMRACLCIRNFVLTDCVIALQ